MEDFDEENKQEPKEKKEQPKSSSKHRIKKSPEYIAYAKSRYQYQQNLAMTQTNMIFKLDATKFKTGVVNRNTQTQPNRFGVAVQVGPLEYTETGVQNPDAEPREKRFPSSIHFIKAATNTILALQDQAEFIAPAQANQILSKINKFNAPGKNTIINQVSVTSTRTIALVEESEMISKICIWNARSPEPNMILVSQAKPSCFCLHGDGRYIIAGAQSGSLLVWDLARPKKAGNDDNVFQPNHSTDRIVTKNHRLPVVGITAVSRRGTTVVCSLDDSATADFWYFRVENEEPTLSKAETVRVTLWKSYFPTFSLAMAPNSVDTFIVGSGCSIWNCSRFNSVTSPMNFEASGAVRALQFSPLVPSLFAAAADNGRVAVYDTGEAEPILEFVVDLSTSDLSLCWSPTRASVLFVAAAGAMRLLVYDLGRDMRKPVFRQKIGNAARSIAAAETAGGVVVAVAEGDNSVSVLRVKQEFSEPFSQKELDSFLLRLYNSQ